MLLLCFFLGSSTLFAQSDYYEKSNMAAFGLTYDWYEQDIEPWQKAFVEYRRYTNRGPIIGRLNIGHRFELTDYQGEIDYWPVISEKWYSYFNVGMSGGDLFPEIRAGAEFYRILPNAYEASLGLRYLKFSQDDVFIITASVSKYLGRWLLIGRPYFTPQDSGVSASFTFNARRYFANPDSFFSLIGGYGFSPDERRLIDGQINNRFLRSRYLGVIGNYLLKDTIELFGELKVTDQQFAFTSDIIRIYTFEFGARYRF